MVHSLTVCCRVLFKFRRKANQTQLLSSLFASIFEALLMFFLLIYEAVTSEPMKQKIAQLFCIVLYCELKYLKGSLRMPIQLNDVVPDCIFLVSEEGYDGSCRQCSFGKGGAL